MGHSPKPLKQRCHENLCKCGSRYAAYVNDPGANYVFKREPQIDHAKESNIENVNLNMYVSVGKHMLGSTNESLGGLLQPINEDISHIRHMKSSIMIYSCAF